MTNYSTRVLLFVLFLCISSISFAQHFEGWIMYKTVAVNPNSENISDEDWKAMLKEQFGEKGYMQSKYYYKGNNYMAEIEAGEMRGFQTYNPKDGLLYSWQEGSDEALTVDSKKNMDEFVEFIESDATQEILGITCQSVILKSKLGKIVLWYNSDHFKVDPKDYEGHLYGHWEVMIKKIGCLPLKMEQSGFMAQVTIEAMEYKAEEVNLELFKIPEFKTLSANPMN